MIETKRCARTRGMALINALIVASALAAMSSALLLRADAARQRLGHQQTADQAALYLGAAIALVQQSVALDVDDSGIVHLGQLWAQDRLDESIDRGHVDWRITDLQGQFNINWLLAEADMGHFAASFARLVQARGLTPALSQRLLLAMDPESATRMTAFVPGVRPPTVPLVFVSQLRLIEGMDDRAFAALTPVLTALPVETALNVNTALPEVLAAFVPNIEAAEIERALAPVRPFSSVDSFLEWAAQGLGDDAAAALEELPLDVGSEWFGARVSARLDMLIVHRAVVLNRLAERRSEIVLSVPEYD